MTKTVERKCRCGLQQDRQIFCTGRIVLTYAYGQLIRWSHA